MSAPTSSTDLLTFAQAAQRLGVGVLTIRAWVRHVAAPGSAMALTYGYPPTGVDELLKKGWGCVHPDHHPAPRPPDRADVAASGWAGAVFTAISGRVTGEIVPSIYNVGFVEDEAHIVIDGHDTAVRFADIQTGEPARLRHLAAVAGALADVVARWSSMTNNGDHGVGRALQRRIISASRP
jgi:hypothetical protein